MAIVNNSSEMEPFVPYIEIDDKISKGLRGQLEKQYEVSEEARMAILLAMGELGEEMSDLHIYPEFKVVETTSDVELHLWWSPDSPSFREGLAMSMSEIGNAQKRVIKAGLLPDEGRIKLPENACLLKDYMCHSHFLCLEEELESLRKEAIKAVKLCFKKAQSFS